MRITIEDEDDGVFEFSEEGMAMAYLLLSAGQDGCVRIVPRTTVSGPIRRHIRTLACVRLEEGLPHDEAGTWCMGGEA